VLELERNVTFLELANDSAIKPAASIFLIATIPGPNSLKASESSYAASASPSALKMSALTSSSLL